METWGMCRALAVACALALVSACGSKTMPPLVLGSYDRGPQLFGDALRAATDAGYAVVEQDVNKGRFVVVSRAQPIYIVVQCWRGGWLRITPGDLVGAAEGGFMVTRPIREELTHFAVTLRERLGVITTAGGAS